VPGEGEGMMAAHGSVAAVCRVRQEPDLIRKFRLYKLEPYWFVPTGSYYLDIMVYPDIDVYMSKVSVKSCLLLGTACHV